MAWYKIWKTFRGGESPVDYMEVPKYTKIKDVCDYAEEWADSTGGGENYGWRVYYNKVRRPSKVWIKNQIQKQRNYLKSNIKYIEELLFLLGK